MHDGLRQISKYLKNTRKNTDFSFKREVPVEEYFERIRDVFDFENPFKGSFKTPEIADKVTLDLNFGPRNPTLDCCADCVCSAMESFISTDLVSNSVYLLQEYIPESTNVFVDGNMLVLGVDYVEAGANQITFITLGETYIISYQYKVGNCHELIFPCLLENFPEPKVFFANALVFSDQFDRASGSNPTGHCGWWSSNQSGTTRREIQTLGGYAQLVGLFESYAQIGGGYPTGKSIEVIEAVDFTGWTSAGTGTSWGTSLHTEGWSFAASATLTSTGNPTTASLAMFGKWFFREGPNTMQFRPGYYTPSGYAGIGKAVNIDMTNRRKPCYIRYAQIPGFGWEIRIWPQDEEEPTTWDMQLTIYDAISGTTNSIGQILYYPMSDVDNGYGRYDPIEPQLAEVIVDTVAIRLPSPQARISAIQVWSGLDTGLYHYNAMNTSSETPHPEYAMGISFPHFVEPDFGLGRPVSLGQSTVLMRFVTSPPRIVRVTGEIAIGAGGFIWLGGGWQSSWMKTFTVLFETYGVSGGNLSRNFPYPTDGGPGYRFGYQDDPANEGTFTSHLGGFFESQQPIPGYTANYFLGQELKSMLLAAGSTDPGTPAPQGWYPFSIDIPVIDGWASWGARIAEMPDVADELPYFSASFLSPNGISLGLSFRNLQLFAIQNVQCTAAPFCPDHTGPGVGEIASLQSGTIVGGSQPVIYAGDEAHFIFTSSNATTFTWADTPFDSANTYTAELYMEFAFKNITSSYDIKINGFNSGPTVKIGAQVGILSDFVSFSGFSYSPSTTITTDFIDSTFYSVRISLDGDNFEFRLWPTGTTEPSVPTKTATLDPVQRYDGLRLDIDGSLGGGGEVIIRNFHITYPTTVPSTGDPVPNPVPSPSPAPVPVPDPLPSTPPPPGGSLQSLIDAAPAGSILTVPVATYNESVNITKAITIDGQGSWIDGQDTRTTWMTINHDDVTVKNFIMANAKASGAIQSGSLTCIGRNRLTLDNLHLIRGQASGINVQNGTGHRFINLNIELCPEQAIASGGLTDFVMNGGRIHHNLTRPDIYDSGFEGGGFKIGGAVGNDSRTNGITITNMEVDHNGGPALWFDININNATITNNRVHHNEKSGIMFEVSHDALIEGNHVWENGWGSTNGWGWGAGILLSSSGRVEIRNNTVAWNRVGISIISQNRPDMVPATQIYMHDNVVVGQHGYYLSGWFQDWSGTLFSDATNHGANDQYWEASNDGLFAYGNSNRDLAQYNATLGEENGIYIDTTTRNTILNAAGIPLTPEH